MHATGCIATSAAAAVQETRLGAACTDNHECAQKGTGEDREGSRHCHEEFPTAPEAKMFCPASASEYRADLRDATGLRLLSSRIIAHQGNRTRISPPSRGASTRDTSKQKEHLHRFFRLEEIPHDGSWKEAITFRRSLLSENKTG